MGAVCSGNLERQGLQILVEQRFWIKHLDCRGICVGSTHRQRNAGICVGVDNLQISQITHITNRNARTHHAINHAHTPNHIIDQRDLRDYVIYKKRINRCFDRIRSNHITRHQRRNLVDRHGFVVRNRRIGHFDIVDGHARRSHRTRHRTQRQRRIGKPPRHRYRANNLAIKRQYKRGGEGTSFCQHTQRRPSVSHQCSGINTLGCTVGHGSRRHAIIALVIVQP